MIELHITETGKGYHPSSEWTMINEYHKAFPSKEIAEAWIDETYGRSKRTKMFRDTPEGTTQVGYVIGFRNADYSHAPVDKWLQQDWIEFRVSEPLSI